MTEILTGSHWKQYENRLKEVRQKPGEQLEALERAAGEGGVAAVSETGDMGGRLTQRWVLSYIMLPRKQETEDGVGI